MQKQVSTQAFEHGYDVFDFLKLIFLVVSFMIYPIAPVSPHSWKAIHKIHFGHLTDSSQRVLPKIACVNNKTARSQKI